MKLAPYKTGLAIFSMFFGAGNLIFPLIIGYLSLDSFPYALAGFLLTAVGVPFLGLFSLFSSSKTTLGFFSKIGKKSGLFLACLILLILGPIGSSPRCLTLAYATLSLSFPGLSSLAFCGICSILLFFFVYRKDKVVSLLGNFLSPLKLAFLGALILLGFLKIPQATLSSEKIPFYSHFLKGLFQGYNTMDLLAAFFFAPLILTSLQKEEKHERKRAFKIASFVGAFLLSMVYLGFSVLSYLYAKELGEIAPEKLLAALSLKILGKKGALLFSITIALSCFTTAVALIAAFTHFVYEELFEKKFSYKNILVFSLIATFLFSTLSFQGISLILTPLLKGIYPLVILLTLSNLFSSFTRPSFERNFSNKNF